MIRKRLPKALMLAGALGVAGAVWGLASCNNFESALASYCEQTHKCQCDGVNCCGLPAAACQSDRDCCSSLACMQGVCRAPISVHVKVTLDGGVAGRVTSEPPGIDCTSDCSHVFPPGTKVMLNAEANDRVSYRWSGACETADVTSQCDVPEVVGGTAEVQVTFRPYNYMFVTSDKVIPGALGGVNAADRHCELLAADAGLPGATYRAWLAVGNAPPAARLGNARGWIRPDGLPFYDDLRADIDPRQVLYVPILDEHGRDAGGTNDVATGMLHDHVGNTCADWTSTTAIVEVGSSSHGASGWSSVNMQPPCSSLFRLYCFGVDYDAPLRWPNGQGRFAFLLESSPSPTGGTAQADQACQNEAANAHLPNPTRFKALLAMNGKSAAERFGQGTEPWQRVDGVMIGTPQELFQATPRLHASLDVNAHGGHSSRPVFTGAATPVAQGTAASTCNDWTGNSAGGVWLGTSESTTAGYFADSQATGVVCPFSYGLYCLQD